MLDVCVGIVLVLFVYVLIHYIVILFFFFQAEDGIRDLVRSRGLGDVYKRQLVSHRQGTRPHQERQQAMANETVFKRLDCNPIVTCLLYTSDAADDLLCVDLGGRRIIKKKKQSHLEQENYSEEHVQKHTTYDIHNNSTTTNIPIL